MEITSRDITEVVVDGRQHFDWVDHIKDLKRDERFEEAEALLLKIIQADELECERINNREEKPEHANEYEIAIGDPIEISIGVAPWYYEQLAIIYSKQKRLSDEVAILERFARQPHSPGASVPKLLERLSKKKAKLLQNV